MPEQLEVIVTSTNQKVQCAGVARSQPPVILDYYPPLGDGQGYTGLELLLMSLAACSGTSVVAMLRKMRRTVSAFQVKAKGIRREQHPTCFEKVWLEFVVTSEDAAETDVQRAIQLSEETYCPVWAMIKNNAVVATEHRIVRSKGDVGQTAPDQPA